MKKLVWSSKLSVRLDRIQRSLEKAKSPVAVLWWRFKKRQLERKIGL